MLRVHFIILIILMAAFYSCSKSNEEALLSNFQNGTANTCTTADMKFSEDIAPILRASCNVCHSSLSPTAGIVTESYSGVKSIADNGFLLGTITHARGFSPMPQGTPKLSTCEINKIRAWITQGTKNN